LRSAWAHDLAHAGDAAAPHAFASWPPEPWALLPLLLVALLYATGSLRLRPASEAGRRALRRRSLLFWAGWGTLALALLGPLHVLSARVFAAHMVEHELLMVAAAPLLVASRPGAVLLWGLPCTARRAAAALLRAPAVAAAWRAATELWSATALHALALWAWHAPGPFLAALAREDAHVLQHLSFLGSALLLWHAALRPRVRGQAVLALFATSLHAGLLGALLAFSRAPWYPGAPDPFPLVGLTRAEDQQLAGLVMWIPACSAYALGALALAGRWLVRLAEARHA
jgi:putative membrane protein